jgi:hypothetical protein
MYDIFRASSVGLPGRGIQSDIWISRGYISFVPDYSNKLLTQEFLPLAHKVFNESTGEH